MLWEAELLKQVYGTLPEVLAHSAEEIAQEAADAGVSNARYVSANLTLQNAADENVVVYIRGQAKRAYDGLTADVVA